MLSDDNLIAPEYLVEREGFKGKTQQRQNGRQTYRQAQKATQSSDNADNDGQTGEANSTSNLAMMEPEMKTIQNDGDVAAAADAVVEKRNGEDNQQIEATNNADAAASDNADGTATASNDDAETKKVARGRGRGQRVTRNDGAENLRESNQTEPSKASVDPATEAAADTSSSDGVAAVKE